MAKVLVPLAKGFEEVEAVGMIDVMRRGGIEVIIAYLNEDEPLVEGANGIVIQAQKFIGYIDSSGLDMIVLPGGWSGTYALSDDERVQSILRAFKSNNKYIGAICAAPFALAKAGVLSSSYTCYPCVEDEIKKDGYRSDKQVVIDNNILTSRGPGTALCFGLAIVKLLVDEPTALSIKIGMLLDFCE